MIIKLVVSAALVGLIAAKISLLQAYRENKRLKNELLAYRTLNVPHTNNASNTPENKTANIGFASTTIAKKE